MDDDRIRDLIVEYLHETKPSLVYAKDVSALFKLCKRVVAEATMVTTNTTGHLNLANVTFTKDGTAL